MQSTSAESMTEYPPAMNLGRMYAYRFRDVRQQARDATWAEISPFIYELMGSPKRLLDPAAGRGEFIANVNSPDRWAVDLFDHGITALQGVESFIGSVDTLDLPLDYFDGVFVSNVLEHLNSPAAVAEFLEGLRSLLRHGGVLAVMGPNFRYCSRDYFDCADHVLALSHRAVEEHLYAAGFTIDRVIPRFLPFSFRSRLPSHPAIVRWYLRLPLAWRVLGKQFLVVARKD
jgi:SAM-dependent methyltransferase